MTKTKVAFLEGRRYFCFDHVNRLFVWRAQTKLCVFDQNSEATTAIHHTVFYSTLAN